MAKWPYPDSQISGQQARLISFIEACSNTLVGFFIALATWYAIRLSGLYEIHTTPAEGVEITLIFTVVSILRGYWLRRIFIRFHEWLHAAFGRAG